MSQIQECSIRIKTVPFVPKVYRIQYRLHSILAQTVQYTGTDCTVQARYNCTVQHKAYGIQSKPNIFSLPTLAPCPQEESVVSYLAIGPKIGGCCPNSPLEVNGSAKCHRSKIVQMCIRIVQLYTQIVHPNCTSKLYIQIVRNNSSQIESHQSNRPNRPTG